MNSKLEEMRDELVRLAAEMDQIQSKINDARILFGHDEICSRHLDAELAHVEHIRAKIALGLARIKAAS